MFPHAELSVTSWFWPLFLDTGSAHALEAGGNRGPSGRPRVWAPVVLQGVRPPPPLMPALLVSLARRDRAPG